MRIILCGFGVVAQSFSELLESRTHDLYSKFGLKPRIVGIFDSKGCAYNETGLDLKKLNKIKKQSGTIRGGVPLSEEEIEKRIGRYGEVEEIPENFEFAMAENKLWLDNHLGNITEPTSLYYEFEKSGSYEDGFTAVSYTHLTLPTILLV